MIRVGKEQIYKRDVVAVVAAYGEADCRSIVYLVDGRELRTSQAPATLQKKLHELIFQKRK